MAPPISGVPNLNRNMSGLVIERPRAIAKPPRIMNPHSLESKPLAEFEPPGPDTVIQGRKTPTTTRMPPARTNHPALRSVAVGPGCRTGPAGPPADIPGNGGSGRRSSGDGGGVGG